MADDLSEPFSLKRWSQRKRAATTKEKSPEPPESAPLPATAGAALVPAPTPEAATVPAAEALPPVESLTFDSDFRAFLQPAVAEDVKRAAFKKLFSDPRFNVMDGLDIYIGDYTLADPMPAGMLDKLAKVYAFVAEPEPGADESLTGMPPGATPTTETPPGKAPPEAPAQLPTETAQELPQLTPAEPLAKDVANPTDQR